MGHAKRNKLVFTVKERCRVCFTCVRECPVKAIKIINGQAEVISERCIGCGNCVNVCSQKAKVYLDSKTSVKNLLLEDRNVVACIAPSFPAEFSDISDYRLLVGMIRKLGFCKVVEVAFGADIVAREYQKLLSLNNENSYISSDCPAIVYYIEHYHPLLFENLAPVVSPMVAVTRIIRNKYGTDTKVVFIGPCIAKKAESDELDEVITFKELREMLTESQLNAEKAEPFDFDPPHPGKGSIFPVSRGLLQTLGKDEDIVDGETIVASGKSNFREVIKEFENGELESKHLELLCCNGCIMGPGMTSQNKLFFKRTQISNYVREKLQTMNTEEWENSMDEYSAIDFSQKFQPKDRRLEKPEDDDIKMILAKMGKNCPEDHLNCGACGYDTCEEHAIAVVQGLAEDEMCLPYTIGKLHKTIGKLNVSNEKLASARIALKHSEKLANMGQLSAGIAHELNNPLGVITMYSNILKEEAGPDDPMKNDLELIVEQAERCKKIVGGLLNFARKNQVRLTEVNLENFVHHSIESLVVPENIKIQEAYILNDKTAQLDTDQMMQVLVNLEKNAVEAMPDGGILTIGLTDDENSVEIRISDTGIGIAPENMDKLFTPFYTTKQIGKGTGLGLPLAYGIVKMHKGQIHVTSNSDPEKGQTGTHFKITIPKYI